MLRTIEHVTIPEDTDIYIYIHIYIEIIQGAISFLT